MVDPIIIDVLELTPPWFKRLYADSYIEVVQKAPELWGYLFKKSDERPYRKPALIRAFDRLNYEQYLRVLRDMRPDAMLCTHFLPYISIGSRVRARGLSPFVAAAVTDFDVHRLWIDPVVQRYYVFHDETAWQLEGLGIDPSAIAVTGIPLMPAFATATSRSRARKSLQLPDQEQVILVLAGGFGVGRIPEIVQATIAAAHDIHRRATIVAIAGKNENLRTAVAAIATPAGITLHSHGFTDRMHDWMAAADLVITKSGGLTSAEALARRLPMVIIDPIPGQESRNADLIIGHGAGCKAIHPHHLQFVLRSLLSRPSTLRSMATASATLAKPAAARNILDDLLGHLEIRPD